MNYFAHAHPFLDKPYFLAGACVPDWLMVADRPVRLRSKQVAPFQNDPDPLLSAVAGGVLKHLDDDARFHNARAFAESTLTLTVMARDALDGETGLRPSFLGHLLTELLLDAALIADEPDRLTEYYRVLETIDPDAIQAAVNRMSHRQTDRLAFFIRLFVRERVLCDYLADDKLMIRLNQIMRRVRLEPLPDSFSAIFSQARTLVGDKKIELLRFS